MNLCYAFVTVNQLGANASIKDKIMPLMEILLESDYYGQQVINRWNYYGTGSPGGVTMSFALAFAMGFIPDGLPPTIPVDGIFALIQSIQSTSLAYNQIIVKDVYSATDFYTLPFPAGTHGALSGSDDMSPVAAYGFRTNRVRADIRRATKRFAGMRESQVDPGGTMNSATLVAMTALADAMSETLSYDDEGSTLTFQPCVVKKEKYETDAGNDAYRYPDPPPVDLTTILALGVTWQAVSTMRTQNSRQYGHGS